METHNLLCVFQGLLNLRKVLLKMFGETVRFDCPFGCSIGAVVVELDLLLVAGSMEMEVVRKKCTPQFTDLTK